MNLNTEPDVYYELVGPGRALAESAFAGEPLDPIAVKIEGLLSPSTVVTHHGNSLAAALVTPTLLHMTAENRYFIAMPVDYHGRNFAPSHGRTLEPAEQDRVMMAMFANGHSQPPLMAVKHPERIKLPRDFDPEQHLVVAHETIFPGERAPSCDRSPA